MTIPQQVTSSQAATLAVAAFLAAAGPAFPATWYVKCDVAAGRSGVSWAEAFRELQSAIAVAAAGDEIWVAAGTYRPDFNTTAGEHTLSRSASFRLANGVILYGGFIGTEAQLSQRPSFPRASPDPNETVLSGDLKGDDGPDFANNVDNSYHVVVTSGTDSTAVLDGFRITAGCSPSSSGGGVYNDRGSPTLVNCTVVRNHGGGMDNLHGSPTLTNCTFSANAVLMSGGGLDNIYGGPVLTKCVFHGNSANGNGGGFYSLYGSPVLRDCVLVGNKAGGNGGGMYNVDGSPALVNCVFSGNAAGEGTGCGGGLYNDSGGPTLTNCTFGVNSAACGGGVYDWQYGSTLTNCILWGNRANGQTDESAQIGWTAAAHPTVDYSCVEGWTGVLGGTGNTGAAPRFADADGADNVVGTGDDDLHLLPGSPCIDAGNNEADTDASVAGLQPLPETDADGLPRIVDDPATPDSGYPPGVAGVVDLGAYEGPRQAFVLNIQRVVVPEGGTAEFTVALAMAPSGPVDVTVERVSGDADIAVVTGPLTFDSGNYAVPQVVRLSAAVDADSVIGQALIQLSAPGIPAAGVTAMEGEDVPAVLYVDADAVGGQSGGSWQDAFVDLQQALVLAAQGLGVEEIRVAQGTYRPGTVGNRDATFRLLNGIAIRGGYAGMRETDSDARDIARYRTVLSGDLSGDDGPGFANNGENSYHVVTAFNCDATAVFDGFTISGGNARNIAADDGGGMVNGQGSPTISNCTFRGNSAYDGAGMSNRYGHPALIDCNFSNNLADHFGGGIYNYYGNPTLTGCTFLDNSSESGGGLHNSSGTPTLFRCSLRGNVAITGGGMHNGDAAPTLTNCVFQANSASAGGGLSNDWGSPVLANCIFLANVADWEGGGIFNEWYSSPIFVNCTCLGNSALQGGGAISSHDNSRPTLTNCILWSNPTEGGVSVTSQIAQRADSAATISYSCIQGWTGALGGTGNRGIDPSLTPDGHLRAGSACIDAGNSGVSAGLTGPTDVDGDTRVHGSEVDMGADEFVDTDVDGLPDWWETRHFDSHAVAASHDDTDGDGLDNLREYEWYGGNPVAPALYVGGAPGSPDFNNDGHVDTADFAFFTICFNGPNRPPASSECGPEDLDGDTDVDVVDFLRLQECFDGPEAPTGPACVHHREFATIQDAIDAAVDGDSVLVGPGSYSGSGNTNLDYGGKSIIVRATAGPDLTIIDCDSGGRAVDNASLGAFAVLEGFTIINGSADVGAGVNLELNRFLLRQCTLTGNDASIEGGGLRLHSAAAVLDNLRLGGNSAPVGCGAVVENSFVYLAGSAAVAPALQVSEGTLELRNAWFDGPGWIDIGPAGTVELAGQPGLSPSVIRSDIGGTGRVHIRPGQTLIIAGDAVVDLGDAGGCKPDPDAAAGLIEVEGTLLLQDRATLRNTRAMVKLAEFKGANDIVNNDITLLESSVGFGGQLFVTDQATVSCNTIVSEGDRYLDLDPDPASRNWNVANNSFHVKITQGVFGSRGTVLECRTQDHDIAIGAGRSGAYRIPDGEGYGDPWALDVLEVLANAKVNLTNRQGFVFQDPGIVTPEAVYVRKLTLHPNAVLNTALQRLYYQTLVLVGADGQETPWTADPIDPLPNGSRIVDEPLLGFSLGIIGMDNDTEFSVRVRRRVIDAADLQPPAPSEPDRIGAIERVAGAGSGTNGVMEMRTQAPGKRPAASVAAKGAFARAGDESVVIAFEYLFAEDPGAEIRVRLSDRPDVGERSFDVARLRVPEAGRPGSIGSGEFAVFYAQFPRVTPDYTLSFVRGTYVEVELVSSRDAQHDPVAAAIWIDNLDPQVICGSECASYDGIEGVSEADFLLLLAHYGRSLDSLDSSHSCLDSKVARDHYVDLGDLLGWDTLFEGSLNACGPLRTITLNGVAATSGARSPSAHLPEAAFLVTGKSSVNVSSGVYDWIYPIGADGAASGEALPPAGGGYSGANGRLLKDNNGAIYQLHGTQGLIRLADGRVMIPPPPDPLPTCNGKAVHVGVKDLGDDFTGVPTADAAVRVVGTETYAYVVPVLVSVPAAGDTPAHSYKAAARLKLSTDPAHPEYYSVEKLYGGDPYHDPRVNADPPEASEYYPYSPREIELARSGAHVFVLSVFGLNDNDWLLTYDEPTGDQVDEDRISELSCALKGPTALLASAKADRLYVTSSADSPAEGAYLYCLAFNPSGTAISLDGKVQITGMRQITAVCERPGDSALYVTGFQMPDIPEDLSTTDPRYWEYFGSDSPVFTTPRWASVPAGTNWSASPAQAVGSQALSGSDLALPLSAVYVGGGVPSDFDGDTDVDVGDFLVFQACFNGPNREPKGADCAPVDLDGDHDVDTADFLVLQACFNGPNRQPKCP